MSAESLETTSLERLAARLEDDIRKKGLRPGDRYLTAQEASTWLEVSPVTANRAMQILAQRDLLVRRRSRGTFVGPKFENDAALPAPLDVIHVFMAMDYQRSHSVSSDEMVLELTRNVPGVTVQMHYIPVQTSTQYCQRIIDQIKLNSRSAEGIVLIRCSRQVQVLVDESGLPAVVYGHAYPCVSLSCVKHDQQAVGKLLAQHALRASCTEFALLMHNDWRLGDNMMLDSITRELATAGVGLDGLTIRSVVAEEEHVAGTVIDILADRKGPIAFLCRNEFFANIVADVAASKDLTLGKDIVIASGGHMRSSIEAHYAQVVSEFDIVEQIRQIAHLLCQTALGALDRSEVVLVPVQFSDNSSAVPSSD